MVLCLELNSILKIKEVLTRDLKKQKKKKGNVLKVAQAKISLGTFLEEFALAENIQEDNFNNLLKNLKDSSHLKRDSKDLRKAKKDFNNLHLHQQNQEQQLVEDREQQAVEKVQQAEQLAVGKAQVQQLHQAEKELLLAE